MRAWMRLKLRPVSNWLVSNRDIVRLWVDDLRPAPRGWYWAVSVDEARDVLTSHYVEEMSLDHDLGPGGEVYDLVLWIVNMCGVHGLNFWPEARPRIHSQNPVGRDNMKHLIDRYGPYDKERR